MFFVSPAAVGILSSGNVLVDDFNPSGGGTKPSFSIALGRGQVDYVEILLYGGSFGAFITITNA
jgi:hypothetical protein